MYKHRMKLQKRFNRKVGDKEYSKWVVVIPPEHIDKIGWKEGEDLEVAIKQNELVIKSTKHKK